MERYQGALQAGDANGASLQLAALDAFESLRQSSRMSSAERLFHLPEVLAAAGVADVQVGDKMAFDLFREGSESLAASPVPLPAAAWLMISGLGGLAAVVRRRREKAAITCSR